MLFIPLGLRPKRKLKLMKTNTIYLEEPNLFCPRTGKKMLFGRKISQNNEQVIGVWFHDSPNQPLLKRTLIKSWNQFKNEQLRIGENMSIETIKQGYISCFNKCTHVDMMLIQLKLRDYDMNRSSTFIPYCMLLVNYAANPTFYPPLIQDIINDQSLISESVVI